MVASRCDGLGSYAVPKEVGKVGAESPTFIQPISQRQDGIQAMFAKQMKSASQESPKKPKKRVMTPEPTQSSPASPSLQPSSQLSSQPSPSKRRKVKSDKASPASPRMAETIDLCDTDDDSGNARRGTKPAAYGGSQSTDPVRINLAQPSCLRSD